MGMIGPVSCLKLTSNKALHIPLAWVSCPYPPQAKDRKAKNIINNYYLSSGRNENLENKLKFKSICEKHGVNTPKILAINNNNSLLINGEWIEIDSFQQFEELTKVIINKSATNSIFVKPVDGSGGVNTFKINTLKNSSEIERLYTLLKDQNFIFQENLLQHKDINKIYSKSINTIRIHTYRKNEELKITSALMRFGMKNSVVDNGSSGGFFIPIKLDNWKLAGKAQTYLKAGTVTFQRHPDTNIMLDDYSLPFKEETFQLVKKAAGYFDNEFIGWDVALTPDGPIIIEGNDGPHIFMLQMACGGIKRHPEYSRIFSSYI